MLVYSLTGIQPLPAGIGVKLLNGYRNKLYNYEQHKPAATRKEP